MRYMVFSDRLEWPPGTVLDDEDTDLTHLNVAALVEGSHLIEYEEYMREYAEPALDHGEDD